MYKAIVILDMPLECISVCGLGMSFNTSHFAVYFHGWLDEVTLVIGDTGRGAIIKHKRSGVRVDLPTALRHFEGTVSPGSSHDGNGVSE